MPENVAVPADEDVWVIDSFELLLKNASESLSESLAVMLKVKTSTLVKAWSPIGFSTGALLISRITSLKIWLMLTIPSEQVAFML